MMISSAAAAVMALYHNILFTPPFMAVKIIDRMTDSGQAYSGDEGCPKGILCGEPWASHATGIYIYTGTPQFTAIRRLERTHCMHLGMLGVPSQEYN